MMVPAPRRYVLFVLASILFAVAAGCGRRAEFEFLAVPRAGLKPGTPWKAGIGPMSAKPARGVKITRKTRGLRWLEKSTARNSSTAVRMLLADFFAMGLGLQSKYVKSVQATELTHRRVASVASLAKGGCYLWETVEAERVRVKIDRSVVGSMAARIARLAGSEVGRRSKLEFWPVAGTNKEVYEVTGSNLVVAVKVVSFDTRSEARGVAVRLGREHQDKDQPGPFGYSIAVKSGNVEIMNRKFKARLRNPDLVELPRGSCERTLSNRSVEIYAGPVRGAKFDGVEDRGYVSGWNFDGLRCRINLQRTWWTLKPASCGLETVK
jgi:hypothetical protein